MKKIRFQDMNFLMRIGAGAMLSTMMALSLPVKSQVVDPRTIGSSDDIVREKKEYRFKMNSGKLSVNVGAVQIEGYAGDEVIITTTVETQKSPDERAQGLRKINFSGLNDNTGLNISKTQEGDLVELRQIQSTYQDTVFIRLPAHLSISIEGGGFFGGVFSGFSAGGVVLSNLTGEIEVSQSNHGVKLIDVTGPATVKSNFGNIEAVFSEPVQGPISLMTSQGFIDVALPTQVKADIELRTSMGELFASPDFNIQVEEPVEPMETSRETTSSELTEQDTAHSPTTAHSAALYGRSSLAVRSIFQHSLNTRLKGKINGGGEHINVRATYGKIYLRTID